MTVLSEKKTGHSYICCIQNLFHIFTLKQALRQVCKQNSPFKPYESQPTNDTLYIS
jgi:hypothetical protein